MNKISSLKEAESTTYSSDESKCLLEGKKHQPITSTPKKIIFKQPRYITMDNSVKLPYTKYISPNGCKGTYGHRFMILINHLYDNPTSFWEIFYHINVALVVLISLMLTFFTDYVSEGETIHISRIVIEFIILVIYFMEFSLRLWSCNVKSKYAFHGRYIYLKKFQNIVDIITMISTVILIVFMVKYRNELHTDKTIHICYYLLKTLQIFRLFRLDRHFGSAKLFIFVLHTYRHELFTAIVSSLFLFLISSFFVYFVEYEGRHYFITPTNETNPVIINTISTDKSLIRSIPEAFYFSVISFLTIGYGDYIPQTVPGKVFVTIMSFVAVAVVALPSNIIGSAFALHVTLRAKERHVRDLHLNAVVFIQRFWRFKKLITNLSDTNLDIILQSLNKPNEKIQSQFVNIGVCGGRRKYDQHNLLRKLSCDRSKLSRRTIDLYSTDDKFNIPAWSNIKFEKAVKNAILFIIKSRLCSSLSLFKNSKKQYLLTDFVGIFESYKNEINQTIQHLNNNIEDHRNSIDRSLEIATQRIDHLSYKIDDLLSGLKQQTEVLNRIIDSSNKE